eukprot:CAMPEP_0204623574 /NCGR_PEP_ID=MMETSP0717-20131115/9300_1 /ASSEMBLY_ACC=CAM_ASM_000666 /TAXON_ID=230516 /ORGANISM="Chaetoceros curvisetus" /LENGTH=203 /DNA_ID=CAMNT_0051638695 /DNA_START=72 /DNA_END=683 /DNA_ORIENTATION=-
MNYNPETEVPTLILSVDEGIIKETYYGENTPPIASDNVDCSACTDYYPDAALSSPKDEYGTLTKLTRHACAFYDNDPSDCCRYDKTTSLCGVYMDSMFLYPCGPSCNKKVNPLTIVLPLLGISALFVLFLVLRRRKNRIPNVSNPGKKDDPVSDTTPFPIGIESGGTNPNVVPVPVVIGEIVQNDSGNYLPTVKAYPELASSE